VFIPGGILEKLLWRREQGIGIDEASATYAYATENKDLFEEAKLLEAEATEDWGPEKFWKIPVGLGKVLWMESFTFFQDEDAVALFREPHGGYAAAESGTNDDVIVDNFSHEEWIKRNNSGKFNKKARYMKKVLIAADSFKDALGAEAVCRAIERGVSRSGRVLETRVCPMGDGGEGTAAIVAEYVGAHRVEVEVRDPLFRLRLASYWITGDGKTAYMEMAEAAGLQLLAKSERNPLQTTTYGVGEMIGDAIDRGVSKLVLCVGGSATHDVGLGMAEALGYVFLDSGGQPVRPVGGNLGRIAYIDGFGVRSGLRELEVEVWYDVRTELTGAARVYGKQKGADAGMVEQLEAGSKHIKVLMEEFTGLRLDSVEGGGAGGGMGMGARVFLGAQLRRGIVAVMDLVDFGKLVDWADLVITGEGKYDGQSFEGKVVSGVMGEVEQRGKLGVVLCGTLGHVTEGPAAFSIVKGPCTLDESISNTAELLEETAYQVVRLAFHAP
jgi:glycerate 2-kinase